MTTYITNVCGGTLFVASLLQSIATVNYLPELFKSQNYAKLALGVNYVSVSISCLHKYYTLKTKHEIFEHLGEWAANIKMEHQRNRIEHSIMRIVEFFNRSCYFLTLVAMSCWTVWPFINRSGPPVPSNLPTSWNYFLTISQILTIVFFAAIIVYTALSVTYMQSILCTEIEYISKCMKKLKYNPEQPLDFKKDIVICVDKHNQNFRILEDIRKIHSGMFGYQVFIAISIACAFIFGVLKKGVLQKVIHYIFPIATTSISEFALMCWLGEKITDEFESLHWNIYNNNWYEAPPAIRRQLTIILEISKTPVYLKGAKVFKASHSTFVEAMRQAFSLFTLLKAMTGE